MPRKITAGETALPTSIAVVCKKFNNYNFAENTIDAKLTLMLRIKYTGIDQDQRKDLMLEKLENELRIRINEKEYHVKNDLNPIIK